MLVTSGVWEAHNFDEEIFGKGHLEAVIRDYRLGDAHNICKVVDRALPVVPARKTDPRRHHHRRGPLHRRGVPPLIIWC